MRKLHPAGDRRKRYSQAISARVLCVQTHTRVGSAHATILAAMAEYARTPPAPPIRTLHHWLGLVMREHREAQGYRTSKVAGLCNLSDSTIGRFESGQQWPAHVDQVLAAYAKALDEPDARVFYDQALARWRSEGEAPQIETDPTARAKSVSAEARRRTTQRPPQ